MDVRVTWSMFLVLFAATVMVNTGTAQSSTKGTVKPTTGPPTRKTPPSTTPPVTRKTYPAPAGKIEPPTMPPPARKTPPPTDPPRARKTPPPTYPPRARETPPPTDPPRARRTPPPTDPPRARKTPPATTPPATRRTDPTIAGKIELPTQPPHTRKTPPPMDHPRARKNPPATTPPATRRTYPTPAGKIELPTQAPRRRKTPPPTDPPRARKTPPPTDPPRARKTPPPTDPPRARKTPPPTDPPRARNTPPPTDPPRARITPPPTAGPTKITTPPPTSKRVSGGQAGGDLRVTKKITSKVGANGNLKSTRRAAYTTGPFLGGRRTDPVTPPHPGIDPVTNPHAGNNPVTNPYIGYGVTRGQCQFPAEWQRGKQWWRGYANDNTEISVSGLDYIYETFGGKYISTFKKSAPNQQLDTFDCVRAGQRGRNYIYVLIKDEKFYCREYAEGDGMLLLRWISVGILSGREPGIQECSDALSSMSSYEVLPLFNPQTGEVGVRPCPLASGVYRTSIVEQTSLGRKTFCENREDSKTTIQRAKIDIETCVRADSYEKPYYSNLYCVADWDGNKLGNNFGQIAAQDKSVLLLYQNKNTNERPHFYVGRYRATGGSLLLSLYVADLKGISGVLTATAEETSVAYKNFIFTRTGDVPADAGLVSETENPVTANCVGGCLNGVCQKNSGVWSCNCKAGYSGKSCERALTKGSCAKSPCMNGLCQQHGNYYYCSCKEGYKGLICDVGQYCLPNPCSRGVCELFQGGYRCLCPGGYTGRECGEHVVSEAEEDKNILIVLTTLLSIFVIGVVVVAVVICQCKRKKEEKLMPANPDGELPNQTYSSMTSWFPDYKRELAVNEETASP